MSKKFSDTLKELRIRAGFSQKQVYERLNIAQSTFSSWETGKAEPPADILLRLCQIYGVDNILGAFGFDGYNEDGSLLLNLPETDLIKKYRALDPYGQDTVLAVLDSELKRCKETKSVEKKDNIIPLQLSLQPASAGTGAYLGPEEMETIFVLDTPLTRQAAFSVPVQGNSMEPDYHDGDILLVERAEDIDVGEVGVFTVDGDGYVKERGEGVLISLNPAYAPVPMSENIRCNGRVIGVLKPEWIVG